MMRSMFAGVSGTRSHQARMDVIGNNIANVNTVGFKGGRVTFEETLVQTLRGASAPMVGGRGGINPMQVGIGVSVRSIDNILTQGSLEATGHETDLAIDGSGFFVVSDGYGQYYTRDGAFSLGADATLGSPATGYKVQGWMADASGNIDTTKPVTDVSILIGQTMNAQATRNVVFRGNLDASAGVYSPGPPEVGGRRDAPITVYDSLGTSHNLIVTLTKSAVSNTWDWVAKLDDGTTVGSGGVTFDSYGHYSSSTGSVSTPLTNGATTPLLISLDFTTLTQYGVKSSVSASFQDGFSAGSLDTFSIDGSGTITGIYSNGQNKVLGRIVLASFPNPSGLLKKGNNLYAASPNSGVPRLGSANEEGRGSIMSRTLEMSNVDLAREFTDMIVTQRGFQANTRLITTADDMLQDLINLRR